MTEAAPIRTAAHDLDYTMILGNFEMRYDIVGKSTLPLLSKGIIYRSAGSSDTWIPEEIEGLQCCLDLITSRSTQLLIANGTNYIGKTRFCLTYEYEIEERREWKRVRYRRSSRYDNGIPICTVGCQQRYAAKIENLKDIGCRQLVPDRNTEQVELRKWYAVLQRMKRDVSIAENLFIVGSHREHSITD